ncbi:MAG: cyclic nucleotide-binding domain-containing protein [Lysobacterales bacterium]
MDLFERFSKLVPMKALAPGDCRDLAKQAKVGRYTRDQPIFDRGDSARTMVFLIEGEVELFSEQGTRIVRADSAEALDPLSQSSPRHCSARAMKESVVAFVDRERLDLMLTWAQSGAVEVQEMGGSEDGDSEDWMSALLSTPALAKVSAAQVGQLFAALSPVEYAKGDFVVREGDVADAYFILCSGTCEVTRQGTDGIETEIGVLRPGDRFGEYALLTEDRRSASVRALEPCSVMRMSGADFRKQLGESMLREVDPDQIANDAVLLDVRLPEEFKRGRLPDSLNMPLDVLRTRMHELDRKLSYIVYCDTGRRSASAAYLLVERGFDAALLRGGISPDEMPVRG